MSLSNDQIITALRDRIGGEQVLGGQLERRAHSCDAGPYQFVPMVVVRPRHFGDIATLFDYCHSNRLRLTFRAAGTSLTGQAVTDGILVDVAYHWKSLRVLDKGRQVAVQPGVLGAHVNTQLARYGMRMGPDPVSIGSCMMGGIAATNASGPSCGVAGTTYHTMAGMQLMLADGFYLDTMQSEYDAVLERERPATYRGLQEIRNIITSDPDLTRRIAERFSMKNTCGYSMNAFVDYESPADILTHLLVGSEGTLGFIGEITLNTLPDQPSRAAALLGFADTADACAAAAALSSAGARVVDILDHGALLAAQGGVRLGFRPEGECAGLLVEFREDSDDVLAARVAQATALLARHSLLAPADFSPDPARRAALGRVRAGLLPRAGAPRETDTAVLMQDVTVRPGNLAECIADLRGLCGDHGFGDASFFGHARDGNLHVVLRCDATDPGRLAAYGALTEDLAKLITEKYDGSLSGEHGTGRLSAPFVEREWGSVIHKLMLQVKRLLDPGNVLSPGVVLGAEPEAHLRGLKVTRPVNPIVDKCTECGFCEPRCPSRSVTLTPRQRIVLRRDLARLRAQGDRASHAAIREINNAFQYAGIETCSADGMCAVDCPLGIDTGALMEELRAERHGMLVRWLAKRASRNFRATTAGLRLGIRFLSSSGRPGLALVRFLSRMAYRMSDAAIPRIDGKVLVPAPAPPLPVPVPRGEHARRVVYYPSCLTRTLGRIEGESSSVGLAQAVVDVLEKIGLEVVIPRRVDGSCCGRPFHEKGLHAACADSLRRTVKMLHEASDGGTIPVICDTSPCTAELRSADQMLSGDILDAWEDLQILDFVEFIAKEIIPLRAAWPRVSHHAVIHPNCALKRMGAMDDLRAVVDAFAPSATWPLHDECCGFATDTGYSVPELCESATKPGVAEVLRAAEILKVTGTPVRYYSTCRTCEIGMTVGTGKVYQSVVHLCYDALVKGPRPAQMAATEPPTTR